MHAKLETRRLQDQIVQLTKEEQRLVTPARKESEKVAKAQLKEKEKQQRKQKEQIQEKDRVRTERESFWPKKVCVVKVNLEVGGSVPITSRRSSTSSHADTTRTEGEDPVEATQGGSQTLTCNLTLSYVTSYAYWSPSYDLALSTISNTGVLCFDALLTNQTSETWNSCKIILSTSQTNFSGLDDAIPSLVPWRVRLASEDGPTAHTDITYSPAEDSRRNNPSRKAAWTSQPPRQQLFGVDTNSTIEDPIATYNKRQSPHTRVCYRSSFSLHATARSAPARPKPMVFQEPSFEETGLTVTYDLPGLKSLPPSSTVSKKRVARVTFAEVVFSHTVVAKYKPAAYLQAKLRNGSNLTLLKGPVGLTLDGGVLGQSTLPRCTPGDAFTLSLGVDPAIQVSYPTPELQRGQLGVFSRENSDIYTRTMILFNARSGANSKAVRLTALDQVPMSEDERLHVSILQPKGVTANGPSVTTGELAIESKGKDSWGKAEVMMKDGGQVVWDVLINAGCTAKLTLQYQCLYPTGDRTVNFEVPFEKAKEFIGWE